jgi:hypothetical protein
MGGPRARGSACICGRCRMGRGRCGSATQTARRCRRGGGEDRDDVEALRKNKCSPRQRRRGDLSADQREVGG